MQEDNGVLYGITYQLAYILQTGIPEWSASEKYFQYNFCQKNGVIYMSKGDNNLNNDPALDTAGTYWDKKDIIQIATDAQAAAGLLETVAINPKQLASVNTNLQNQIDTIQAASDVTDIVGTYADLQNYDTTDLPNNSIIKVLADETHDDEIAYYRWVITGGVGAWVLIGEEGPYLTPTAASNTYVKKVDIATNSTLGIVKIGTGLNVAADGTLSTASQATSINVLATSGTIALIDNSVNSITPTADVTFTLPTVTDNTVFHQILIQVDQSTAISWTWGTTYYFGGVAPDMSNTGYYNIIYEYDSTKQAWCVGAVSKAEVV